MGTFESRTLACGGFNEKQWFIVFIPVGVPVTTFLYVFLFLESLHFAYYLKWRVPEYEDRSIY